MTSMECGLCGRDLADCTCGIIAAEVRERAHKALDRWLDDCRKQAQDEHERGVSGTIGTCTLRAIADGDCEISIELERTILELV